MRAYWIAATVTGLALLTGCARARVTTEIQKDGSWARTLTFTGQAKKDKEGGPQMGLSVEEVFVIPSGAGWKSKQEAKNDDQVITADRLVPVGGSLTGDLSIKDQPGKVRLANEVAVKRAGPGRFEYRETLTWKGDAPPSLGDLKPEDLAAFQADLPKALATPENVRALARKVQELAIPLMFGPGDPLLALGLLHPDLAERRATQRIGTLFVKALEQQFGDKMAPAERREVARRFIRESLTSLKPAKPDPAAGPPAENKSGLTPLMFIVKTPGRIVSSNGEVDEFTGEVFWAMFEEAAAYKQIVLTAVVDMN